MGKIIYCNDLDREINKGKCYNSVESAKCKACTEKPSKLPAKKTSSSKSKKPKRLSQFDRVMATIRCNEYAEDYHNLSQINDEKKAKAFEKELINKWNLNPLPPVELFPSYKHPKHCEDYPCTVDDSIIEISEIPDNPLNLELESASNLSTFINDVLSRRRDGYKANKEITRGTIDDFMKAIESKNTIKGKYLYLRVDISKTQKELEKSFKSIIKRYKSYLPKDDTRNKNMIYSPWDVYHLKHQGKLNLLQITKRLTGLKGNTGYDNKLMKEHKAVKRAYAASEQMIKQVKNEAKAKLSIASKITS